MLPWAAGSNSKTEQNSTHCSVHKQSKSHFWGNFYFKMIFPMIAPHTPNFTMILTWRFRFFGKQIVFRMTLWNCKELVGYDVMIYKHLILQVYSLWLKMFIRLKCKRLLGVDSSVHCVSVKAACLSACLPNCLPIYLCVHLSFYPSDHLSIYQSISPSIHPSIYLSVNPSMYLSILPSMYVCMSVCMCVI